MHERSPNPKPPPHNSWSADMESTIQTCLLAIAVVLLAIVQWDELCSAMRTNSIAE
jgi:hypothetical protein